MDGFPGLFVGGGAWQMFLAARDGTRRGLKVGLVDPKTEKMQTEFIGL
jgi:hypothetical protein